MFLVPLIAPIKSNPIYFNETVCPPIMTLAYAFYVCNIYQSFPFLLKNWRIVPLAILLAIFLKTFPKVVDVLKSRCYYVPVLITYEIRYHICDVK